MSAECLKLEATQTWRDGVILDSKANKAGILSSYPPIKSVDNKLKPQSIGQLSHSNYHSCEGKVGTAPYANRFLKNINLQLKEWIGKGYEVVLSSNLIEKLGADVCGFARITAEWNLVEMIQHYHDMQDKTLTYARGTRCLHYIFCITNLLPSITKFQCICWCRCLWGVHCVLLFVCFCLFINMSVAPSGTNGLTLKFVLFG